ncbi:MAG: serine hydrolase domain-containing protein [Candidatus Heimdallarchaeaceae archaeon]
MTNKQVNKLTNKKKILTALLIFVFLLSLSSRSNYVYSNSIVRDYWPTYGWQTKTLEEVNMSDTRIDSMFDYIDSHEYYIESLLVIKDGYLVVEEYLQEDTAETRQIVYSVTKSFMSTLIGIAIDEDYIESVNQKMFDFLYDASIPNIELKENITIYHLLTMTSGIAWNENVPFDSPLNNKTQMKASDNWVEYVLSCEMDCEPGTTFNYNTGGSHLLSAILEEAIGNSSLEYATEHILDSLGISNISWFQDPQGIYFGGSLLELLPRDMAKFGYLFLNNGSWDGTQIISKEWVQDAANATIYVNSEYSYGYQWWYYTLKNYYFASGLYMQQIFVISEYDIVVVITADERVNSISTYADLIDSFIVLAAKQGYTAPLTETTLPFIITSSILILSVINKRRKRN